MDSSGPALSPAEYIAFDSPPKDVPIRRHNLAAVHGGATPLELACPGFVNISVGNVFETFEYPRSHIRTILLRKVKNFGK